MKSKKIYFILLMVIFVLLVGIKNVQASNEINSPEDLAIFLGNKNCEINNNTIKLTKDINLTQTININRGNYIIDFNGHKIISNLTHYKNREYLTFNINGGTVIFKDDTGDGGISSIEENVVISNAYVKVLGGLYETQSNGFELRENGILEFDNGIVKAGNIAICEGGLISDTLIINDGIFYGGISSWGGNPFNKELEAANIFINGGYFIGTSIFSPNTKDRFMLKGGKFINSENDESLKFIWCEDEVNEDSYLQPAYRFNHSNYTFKVDDEYPYGDKISGYAGPAKYEETYYGATEIIKNYNISTIYHNVVFVDLNGKILKTEKVLNRGYAVEPNVPAKEGYVFTKWSEDINNITRDIIVVPVYEKIFNFVLEPIAIQKYTGNEIIPSVIVKDKETGKRLILGTDYEIECSNNVNVGTADITIKGIGQYKYAEEITEQFDIYRKVLNSNNTVVTMENADKIVYTGTNIKPAVEVICDNIKLIKNVDYKIEYSNNIKVGFANITIEGLGNYSGNIFANFNIKAKELKENNIQIDTSDKIYTGNAIEPKVVVKDGTKVLEKGKDYLVYYRNNYLEGKATIIVNGYGNYSGEFTKTFNIVKKDITKISSISVDTTSKVYTGKNITTSIVLKDGTTKLKEGTDYTVIYSNNKNCGTATVKIVGKGIYKGTITKTFNIIKNTKDITKISSISVDTTSKVYTGKNITTSIVLKDGTTKLKEGTDYTVTYSNNKNCGTATVKIVGKGIYKGTITKTFNIIKNTKDITKISSISVDTTSKVYTGKNITTSIVLKDGTTKLKEGTDYTVTYSNNKNYGTATVKIVGKGNFKGTITKTFTIKPKKVTITSLKNTILRCVEIKWSKNSDASGYEIYRSKSSNGTYTNVDTVKSNLLQIHTFVAQAKGTYYYKIRSYVVVNGTKIYSDFSDIKTVKVTK